MKLLVVSHPCIMSVNQAFYAEVERLTGWDLTLVVPALWRNEYGEAHRPQRFRELRGRLLELPVIPLGNIPLHVYRSRLGKVLRRERPDAVYVHHEPYALSTIQFYMASRFNGGGCPIGFYAAQNLLKRYPAPIVAAERWVYRRSAFAFPVTQEALDVLREKGYQGPATVLPLPLDLELYRPRPQEAEALRRELGLPETGCVLGYVGRLVEEKGIDDLLQALSGAREKRWELLLIGQGPMEAALRESVERLGLSGRVHFLGYVPHESAPAYLALLDLLILPSRTRPHWKEQFGRVLLEALACGTPVLGSDSGSIPSVIAATGGGLTFPEGDIDALMDLLNLLIDDPAGRIALADQGRKAVRNQFSQEAVARRFADTIVSALGEAG